MKKLIFLLAGISAACSPEIRAYTDYDRDYDVAQFQTYCWANPHLTELEGYPLYYNELNDKRIKRAVDDLMAVRGYVRTDSSTELTLNYKISIEERSVFAPDPYGYMYGDYFMRPRQDIFKYREGTLVLNIVNSANQDLIWRGWAVGALEVMIYEGKDVDIVIKSAVAKILQNFPVSVKKRQLDVTTR